MSLTQKLEKILLGKEEDKLNIPYLIAAIALTAFICGILLGIFIAIQ
jgi:hypothetical protein